jgi:hypothetical protein
MESVAGVTANHIITIEEGKGTVERQPFSR